MNTTPQQMARLILIVEREYGKTAAETFTLEIAEGLSISGALMPYVRGVRPDGLPAATAAEMRREATTA